MVQTFNLIHEPWIPVVRLDNGQPEEVGLREALCRAHELRAVQDPLPTAEFGLYRLLTALALDIFELDDTQMLSDVLDGGLFHAATVDAYFAQWQDRFDLFSKTLPFLQTAGMEGDAEKSLAGLLPSIPSGTNAAHFHHAPEAAFGVCPAAAARLLTTMAPFMTAGGAGLAPALNGAPPWYALIVGDTLFGTLCRNAFVLDRQRLALGVPAWRNDSPINAAERCKKADLLAGWTWRPRRIQLVPGEAGRCALTGQDAPVLVRSMRFAAGASCDFTDGGWRDPQVPYKVDDKGPKVMRPQEGKEVWRDTAPLALLTSKTRRSGEATIQFTRPEIIEQWALMTREHEQDKTLVLALYGMRTDLKMKVFEWHREILSLPRSLVLQKWFAEHIPEEMKRAEDIAYALKRAIQKTYKRDGKGNPKAFEDLIVYAQRQFWNDVHPAWQTLLNDAAPLTPADAEAWARYQKKWWDVLRKQGGAALNGAIGDLDTDAEALKRQVEAEQYFGTALYIHLATEQEKTAREAAKKSRKPAKEKPQGTAA